MTKPRDTPREEQPGSSPAPRAARTTESRDSGARFPWGTGPQQVAATVTSAGGFRTSSVGAFEDEVAAQSTAEPGKTEASPDPREAPVASQRSVEDYTGTDAYKCATAQAREAFGAHVLHGPIDFTSDNLGLIAHDINDLNTVYTWSAHARIPAGARVIRSNDLVHVEARRQILGKQEVG